MARIYIETYGCSLNHADSHAMISLLEKADFTIVNSPEDSDLVILNTCTVKTPTETKILRRIKELNKPLVIAGCMPQAEPSKKELAGYAQVGVFQIPNIVQIVEEALENNPIIALAHQEYNRLNIPHSSPNKVIDIIPICQGCLGAPCTYCLIKKARGNLFSYEPNAILRRVQDSVDSGKKVIWLTAQDTGAYGKDIGTNLPELLKLLTQVKGNYWLRVGMANPNHVKEYLYELIEVFKSPRIFKFLHIPVQSGSNKVLEKMRREYTREEFIAIVNEFKKEIPNITISTDLIAGFPGETDSQFQESISLLEEVKPGVLNISRFWPRPSTPAAKMKQCTGTTIKNRSRKITETFRKVGFDVNHRWLGWSGAVVISEKGSGETWKSRNISYKPIIVPSNENLLGKIIKVKVFDITSIDLRAKKIV